MSSIWFFPVLLLCDFGYAACETLPFILDWYFLVDLYLHRDKISFVRTSFPQKWNQMPRFQRKLILLTLLVVYFIVLLLLHKLQSEKSEIVVNEVEGPRIVRITITPFGMKEVQEENEEARAEFQKVRNIRMYNWPCFITNSAKLNVLQVFSGKARGNESSGIGTRWHFRQSIRASQPSRARHKAADFQRATEWASRCCGSCIQTCLGWLQTVRLGPRQFEAPFGRFIWSASSWNNHCRFARHNVYNELDRRLFPLTLKLDFEPRISYLIFCRLQREPTLGWTTFGSEKYRFGQLLRGDYSRAWRITISLSFEWRECISIESSNFVAMIYLIA